MLKQVDEAVAHGAKILDRGQASGSQGFVHAADYPHRHHARQSRVPAGVLWPRRARLPAKDEEEAIAIANDSPFGLGGSIYTKDIEHGKRVASRIETGMVFINYPSVSTADLPFGGIKRSGYGKELSDLGIQEFVNKKLICAANGFSLVA